jgi:hypothetical protein
MHVRLCTLPPRDSLANVDIGAKRLDVLKDSATSPADGVDVGGVVRLEVRGVVYTPENLDVLDELSTVTKERGPLSMAHNGIDHL